MNQNVSLCDENYSDECFKMLANNDDFSPVVICQNSGKNNILNRIKLTSDVKLYMNDCDINNKNYRSIKQSIIEEDNHIIIVGSDIINCYKEDKDDKQEELLKRVKLYSNISYKYFNEKHKNVGELLKESNVNKTTISNMFNEVFKISGEEEDIIIKEENLRQREDNMIIKEHDLFTKEVGIGTKYEQLIKQRYNMYHTQMVLYTSMMFLTVIFNYNRIIEYLL